MVTLEQIKSNLFDTTSEQIGKAHKVFGPGNEEFYLVENSKGDVDDNGDVIEYPVRYSLEHGFTCGCACGLRAFSNVSHPSGVCWHVRAAVACFLEQEAYMQELAEKKVASTHNAALPIVTKSTHSQALPVVKISTIEASMPKWIMEARPSKGMDKAPRER